jgi:hypothetical protein
MSLITPARTAAGRVDAATVRDALADYDRPSRLLSSPLAVGTTPQERVASVRRTLENAVAATFGVTDDERLMRSIVELGYMDPLLSHEAAAATLHLSRAAYFRRLGQAIERVAAWLEMAAEDASGAARFRAGSSGRRRHAEQGRRAAA